MTPSFRGEDLLRDVNVKRYRKRKPEGLKIVSECIDSRWWYMVNSMQVCKGSHQKAESPFVSCGRGGRGLQPEEKDKMTFIMFIY